MAIRGIREARRNTRKIIGGIRESASKAVVEMLVSGRSYTLMLTPIDTGNLANSAFIDTQSNKSGARGRFGFTAAYAAAVHEMPGTLKGQPRGSFGSTSKGSYWDPDAEPRFVKKGFEDNVGGFDGIVMRNMKR